MARPPKDGIDYFPFDVGFFDDKEKIKPLISKYGADAVALLIYLYCDIYKNGFFIKVNEDYINICSMDLRMNVNKIRQMLNNFLERSLFDGTLFKTVKVLTARAIQERYQLAVRERVRKNKAPVLVDRKLWLIPEKDIAEVSVKIENVSTLIKVISFSDIPRKNEVILRNNEVNPRKNDIKESKEKESNIIYTAAPAPNRYFSNPELNNAFLMYVNIRLNNGDKLQPEQILLLKEQLDSLSSNDTEKIAIVKKASVGGKNGCCWKNFYPLAKNKASTPAKPRNNRFKNFPEREYDMDSLEKQLIEKNRKGGATNE